MLNRPLYEVLKARFSNVRITNENVRRVESGSGRDRKVIVRGENYNVDCPICGDTKGRLSISYLWLEKRSLSTQRRSDLAHCYNENCPVHQEEFWRPLLDDIEAAKMGILVEGTPTSTKTDVIRTQLEARLPEGFVTLDRLPSSHPALEFIFKQYNGSFDPVMLAKNYGVGYTDVIDLTCPQAQNRIIYPIYSKGKLVAWQGRATLPEMKPRWYLPPGFVKVIYNADNVSPIEIPVVAEGIPSSIACGKNGVGVFGSALTQQQLDTISSTWSTVLIATDPDTFVPDNRPGGRGIVKALEMKKQLDRLLKSPAKLIQWPVSLLELARKYNNGEDVRVPDPADIGPLRMSKLIERSLHVAHHRAT